MNQERIPVLVGVTGHRAIREADRAVLLEAVKRELNALKTRCPNSEPVMLNSLAEGADQLCAEAAEALGIPLIAVLPMPQEVYEKDFSGAALTAFRAWIAKAKQVFVAPSIETAPETPGRDFGYRQAGIYVAEHAHVLLALWDGKPGVGKGCGTADAVDFFLRGAYRPKYGAPLLNAGVVLHIRTPRGDSPDAAGTVTVLGNRDAWEEECDRIEEFNRLAAACSASKEPILPEDHEPDPALDCAEALYAEADALSLKNAAQYRRVLSWVAIISTAITVAFLLYNEAKVAWMIVVCGLSFLAAWGLLRYAKRSACHRRYITYRTLAEGLRVQAFLRYAGCKTEAAVLLPWPQQDESPWIAAAMHACSVGGEPKTKHEIRRHWVEAQRDYHARAAKKGEKQCKRSERIVRVALILSISLYAVSLIMELLSGTILPIKPLFTHTESRRSLIEMLLGGISAATLFISNYYGRLSLKRTVDDHKKMARFYARMDDRLEQFGQPEEILVQLAREELIETGNWRSYQQDNAPELNI